MLGRPANLEDFLRVALKGMELRIDITQVEERHSFVRRSRGHDPLIKGIKREAVHLGRVRLHSVESGCIHRENHVRHTHTERIWERRATFSVNIIVTRTFAMHGSRV